MRPALLLPPQTDNLECIGLGGAKSVQISREAPRSSFHSAVACPLRRHQQRPPASADCERADPRAPPRAAQEGIAALQMAVDGRRTHRGRHASNGTAADIEDPSRPNQPDQDAVLDAPTPIDSVKSALRSATRACWLPPRSLPWPSVASPSTVHT
ncbi:hypothetical protein BV25DRAFT_1415304 [Artomyces pyxidatus]|uniref:Uncharacterized protein n=1 Tax=Artomyces pyxidatus TaxID=48021 RepID=A0ACB8TE03_9AGAM|nr:hypothetical protein BV25DRAFT_1415304 [Artomyces pyxidatus]